MKSTKRQREKGASDTEEPERAGPKKSKTQVSVWLLFFDLLFILFGHIVQINRYWRIQQQCNYINQKVVGLKLNLTLPITFFVSPYM